MIFVQRGNTTDINGSEVDIAFPASIKTLVYPCSRRRSVALDTDNNPTTGKVSYPFDPEARLNTEHNHRRNVSTNGYVQSFLSGINIENVNPDKTETAVYYPSGSLDLTIAGYSFKVQFDAGCIKAENDKILSNSVVDGVDFIGKAIAEQNLEYDPNATNLKIYANIRIEAVKLYETLDNMVYHSWILHHQDNRGTLSGVDTALDVLRTSGTETVAETPDNHFFSGLSFSVHPLTANNTDAVSEYLDVSGDNRQLIVSICILKKNNNRWEINQEALLPYIRHGIRANSIEVGYINALGITQNNVPVASLQVENLGDNKYQLVFNTTDDCEVNTPTT